MSDQWLESLITDTPQQGFELAITLSRRGVKYTQPDADVLHTLRPEYANDSGGLTAASQVVAINFQTVAAANNYWRKSPSGACAPAHPNIPLRPIGRAAILRRSRSGNETLAGAVRRRLCAVPRVEHAPPCPGNGRLRDADRRQRICASARRPAGSQRRRCLCGGGRKLPRRSGPARRRSL